MNVDTYFLYGRSGAGKTTQLAQAARYLVKELGMTGRYAYADSGDEPFGDLITMDGPMQSLDITAMCRPTQKKPLGQSPMAILNALADGYWRVPTKTGYTFAPAPLVDFYMFESLYEFGGLVMQDHIRNGRKIAEDLASAFTATLDVAGLFDDEGNPQPISYPSGQAGRAHYGHVQRYIMNDWWPRCKALQTRMIFVTTHETTAGEDDDDKKVVGPAIIGKAGIDKVTQRFQAAIHMTQDTIVKNNVVQEIQHRGWFINHPLITSTGVASNTLIWPAKISLPLEESREFLKLHPQGYLDFNKTTLVELIKLHLKGNSKQHV